MENDIECWNCGIPYDKDRFNYKCPDCREVFFEPLPEVAPNTIRVNMDAIPRQHLGDVIDMYMSGTTDNFGIIPTIQANAPVARYTSTYQQQFDAYSQLIQQLNTEVRRPENWTIGIDPYINPENTNNIEEQSSNNPVDGTI